MSNYSVSLNDRLQTGDLLQKSVSYSREFVGQVPMLDKFSGLPTLVKKENLDLDIDLYKRKYFLFAEKLGLNVDNFELKFYGDAVSMVAESMGYNPFFKTVIPPSVDGEGLGYNAISKVVIPPALDSERTDYHTLVDWIGNDDIESIVSYLQNEVYSDGTESSQLTQQLNGNSYPEESDSIDLEVE